MTTEIDARPAVVNLRLYAGDNFSRTLQFTDSNSVAIDITGWAFVAQVRETPASGLVLAAFTVNVTDAANGTLTISLTGSQTNNLEVDRLLSWDLQATDAGTVRTYIRGSVKVETDVSRG